MITKLNDFERIQCLCLDRRIDQVLKLEPQWAARGIKVERFMTGDGKMLDAAEYNLIDQPNKTGRYKFSYNMREIISRAKKDNLKNILILEDDCRLLDGFDSLFEYTISYMNENSIKWDLLYLGANHTWAKTEEISPTLLKCHGGTYTTHAYALNNENKIFDTILNIDFDLEATPFDLILATVIQPNNNCYALWPNLAIQEPCYSYINNSHADYTDYFQSKGHSIHGDY